MGVDSTLGTEIVPGGHCIELIQRERFLALQNFHVVQLCGNDDCAAHTAIGAGAPAGRMQAIGQPHVKTHGAAMTAAVDLINIPIHVCSDSFSDPETIMAARKTAIRFFNDPQLSRWQPVSAAGCRALS